MSSGVCNACFAKQGRKEREGGRTSLDFLWIASRAVVHSPECAITKTVFIKPCCHRFLSNTSINLSLSGKCFGPDLSGLLLSIVTCLLTPAVLLLSGDKMATASTLAQASVLSRAAVEASSISKRQRKSECSLPGMLRLSAGSLGGAPLRDTLKQMPKAMSHARDVTIRATAVVEAESKPDDVPEKVTTKLEKAVKAPAAMAVKAPAAKGSRGGNIPCDWNDVVMFQGFNWESNKNKCWYDVLKNCAKDLSEAGITDVWLPPPSQSVAPQGEHYLHLVKGTSYCWILLLQDLKGEEDSYRQLLHPAFDRERQVRPTGCLL